MKAVILAAGQGTRLKPLTNTRPKAMLYAAGKPILHHLLLEAKKAGVTEAVIVVGYLKEQVISYFKKLDLGMKISFAEQGEAYGTAQALLAAKGKVDSDFLVLAGDMVTEAKLISSVMQAHEKGKNRATLALKKVPNPSEYGVAVLDSGSSVKEFQEKSPKPKSDLANLSVYCFSPRVFEELAKLKKSDRGELELVEILKGAKAVVSDAFWLDVAYPWHLFDANEFLLSKMPAAAEREAIENSTIKGKVIMEKGAKIISSHVEGMSYIGENTVIGPGAFLKGFNSIGKNCQLGGGTTLKNSILFDNVNAKHLSYIGDSIVGEGVNFGSGTQIANYRFDGGTVNVSAERGWVNSGRKKLGAIVGDNVKFGVNACTMPGKLIGENCWIGSGTVINKNIAPNTHVLIKQELSEFVERKK